MYFQFAFAEEDEQPIPVKRRKKNLIFDSDDDLDDPELEGLSRINSPKMHCN